jgi:hypothetical protein
MVHKPSEHTLYLIKRSSLALAFDYNCCSFVCMGVNIQEFRYIKENQAASYRLRFYVTVLKRFYFTEASVV